MFRPRLGTRNQIQVGCVRQGVLNRLRQVWSASGSFRQVLGWVQYVSRSFILIQTGFSLFQGVSVKLRQVWSASGSFRQVQAEFSLLQGVSGQIRKGSVCFRDSDRFGQGSVCFREFQIGSRQGLVCLREFHTDSGRVQSASGSFIQIQAGFSLLQGVSYRFRQGSVCFREFHTDSGRAQSDLEIQVQTGFSLFKDSDRFRQNSESSDRFRQSTSGSFRQVSVCFREFRQGSVASEIQIGSVRVQSAQGVSDRFRQVQEVSYRFRQIEVCSSNQTISVSLRQFSESPALVRQKYLT